MPLFFSSSALYPEAVMPGWVQAISGWVQAISKINPLPYEVDALRGLLMGTPTHLGLDAVGLVIATVLGLTGASLLLPRVVSA
jgi:ABC-2 type transport system permease protein